MESMHLAQLFATGTTAFYCIISGLLLNISLRYAKLHFVSPAHTLFTYGLLPFAIHILVISISGDLALSLGMIGALSIVRFRNPVKSQVELVALLALICIGIAYYGSKEIGFFATIVFCVAPLILYGFSLTTNSSMNAEENGQNWLQLIVQDLDQSSVSSFSFQRRIFALSNNDNTTTISVALTNGLKDVTSIVTEVESQATLISHHAKLR